MSGHEEWIERLAEGWDKTAPEMEMEDQSGFNMIVDEMVATWRQDGVTEEMLPGVLYGAAYACSLANEAEEHNREFNPAVASIHDHISMLLAVKCPTLYPHMVTALACRRYLLGTLW